YGTLLDAPAGGVKPDPFADPVLREILRQHGHEPSASPSADLHAAVLRHHAAAGVPYPEIDLRVVWRDVLSLPPEADTTGLVLATEAAWHPATLIPGAAEAIQRVSRSGLTLGLLSNAQCNTLASLGGLADLFWPEFILLSYQQGMSKPAPELFEMLADRLAGRGITPAETLYIGNDPLHDIVPAAAAGFRTALFTGHPGSHRPGECSPDFRLADWKALSTLF
ncbi:MAG: HAD family hydrolase, partial [Verrucomicrobiaceae bacterium]